MLRLKRVLWALVIAVLAVSGSGSMANADLDGPASIVFDQFRVPTIVATTEHDAIYLQGYMHAKDRLFQMDFQRHLFSGRVSELTGPAGIPTDVQLRTLGLRRAAEASLPAQTPEVLAWLEAYAEGVNAFLANTAQPLPLEYSLLEIDRGGIEPWTPVDSLTMVKGLAFGLSFDLSDIDRTIATLTFLEVCGSIGCNGLQLANDDLYRVAPFEATLSIPSTPIPPPGAPPEAGPPEEEELPDFMLDPSLKSALTGYRDTIAEIPILKKALERDFNEIGSNWWVASGANTESGFPMLANDPHLALNSPATFYEIHLNVTGGINVTGTSFPGAPGVVLGCNDTVCWGATVNAMDVTDVFQEVLVAPNPAAPTSPAYSVYLGSNGDLSPPGPFEDLVFIPQAFFVNVFDGVLNNKVNAGVPADQGGVTIVVPRRNNGPIVQVNYDPAAANPLTGFSVQYTGWGPTQELETFRRFASATNMTEFKEALQYFDVGSQNFAYADINGNIAYYTSGEMPIREDLQTLFFPDGLLPPNLVRDGTNTNKHEWLGQGAVAPEPNQALSTRILPFAEMPQLENPPSGYIINANNDPIGTTFDNNTWNQFRPGFNGLLYLSSGYATGYRSGQLQRHFDDLLAGGGTLSLTDNIEVQGSTKLLDAEILSPFLLAAHANADAAVAPELAAYNSTNDPQLADAIARLAAWDFTTPTGIIEGFDLGDNPLAPVPPSAAEIDASVAATIYALWRGQAVQRVVDTTLANRAGVCTGDFATLCNPTNDTCGGGVGGVCFPISVLSDQASPSDQSMALLRRLLENYAISGGTGVSLINFFKVPGVANQDTARDIILLQALRDALDLAASPEFDAAFGGSTNLEDYRWGKLHRIVFDSDLDPALSIPPAGSPQNLSPDLKGFATDGGMGVLDASSHSARADGLDDFMFGSGPSRRVIATMAPTGPDVLEVLPGGESGVPGSPQQTDQLGLWLVNAYKPLPVSLADVDAIATETMPIACGDGTVDCLDQCDDGNNVSGDGCDANCVIEFCGDGTVNNTSEECDDGGTDPGDGCDANCVIEFCGDGIVNNVTEECDDGGAVAGDGCSEACVIEFCGDGIVNNNGEEECDTGGVLNGTCSSTCTSLEPIPTVSEWGLIIMMLLLLTAGTLVLSSVRWPAVSTVTGAGRTGAPQWSAPPFDRNLLAKVFAGVLGVTLLGFAGAFALFGTLSSVDVVGALMSAPIVAYLVHLFVLRGRD